MSESAPNADYTDPAELRGQARQQRLDILKGCPTLKDFLAGPHRSEDYETQEFDGTIYVILHGPFDGPQGEPRLSVLPQLSKASLQGTAWDPDEWISRTDRETEKEFGNAKRMSDEEEKRATARAITADAVKREMLELRRQEAEHEWRRKNKHPALKSTAPVALRESLIGPVSLDELVEALLKTWPAIGAFIGPFIEGSVSAHMLTRAAERLHECITKAEEAAENGTDAATAAPPPTGEQPVALELGGNSGAMLLAAAAALPSPFGEQPAVSNTLALKQGAALNGSSALTPPDPEIKDYGRPRSAREWIERDDIEDEPDYMLGKILHTETVGHCHGLTGIGKSFFALEMNAAVAMGTGFGGWKGSGKKRKVLMIDGEMSPRQIKKRLTSLASRYGEELLDRLWVYSFLDSADAVPLLNTEEGRLHVLRLVDEHQPDLVTLDNRQSLTEGSMKDDESWRLTLPLQKELKRRHKAQVWFHHSNADGSMYGDKSAIWQADWSIGLKEIKEPEIDLKFKVLFEKAREKDETNREDFEERELRFIAGAWQVKMPGSSGARARTEEGDTGPKGRNQKVVAETFIQLVLEKGLPNPAGAGFPNPGTVDTVGIEELIDSAAGKLTDTPSRNRAAVRTAVNAMIDRYYLRTNEGRIWSPSLSPHRS